MDDDPPTALDYTIVHFNSNASRYLRKKHLFPGINLFFQKSSCEHKQKV